jgi:hypothetical protein
MSVINGNGFSAFQIFGTLIIAGKHPEPLS